MQFRPLNSLWSAPENIVDKALLFQRKSIEKLILLVKEKSGTIYGGFSRDRDAL